MFEECTLQSAESGSLTRVVGHHRGDRPGPTLVCVGGIHGNEPAGVHALRRVFAALHRLSPPFRGQLLGLAGNLAGLARGLRYLREDLNRIWLPDRLSTQVTPDDAGERREQRQLLELLDQHLLSAGAGAYFLDLHTTSADTAPFAVIADTLRSRRFALRFPVPIVLGLEEQVEGTITEYVENHGVVTMGFEAGAHTDPGSIDRHEAAVWLACAAAGNITPRDAPQVARARTLLADAARGLPRILEVRHRHAVLPDSGFIMLPGLRNFQPISARQLLARDRQGDILAPEPGCILMPLYQPLGDDGFFVVRPVRRVWLRISAVLRYLGLARALRLLPGIQRHPLRGDALRINPAVARWYAVEIFHLLGYRRRRQEGRYLVFSRRLERPRRRGSAGYRSGTDSEADGCD